MQSLNKITFVKNGKTDYKILIKTHPTVAIENVCKDLQSYLKKIFDIKFEIVYKAKKSEKYICIGNNDKSDLFIKNNNSDGYVLKTDKSNIYIFSNTDRGYIYGIYDFIKKFLGVKIFSPDEEYVPVLKNKIFEPINEDYTPVFDMRTYLTGNVIGSKANKHYASKIKNNSNWLDLGIEFGGTCQMYGRKRENGGIDHNMIAFVPPKIYMKEHPEFFIKDRNAYGDLIKLDIVNGITKDGKLSKDGESVLKTVIEEMKFDILSNPSAKYFVFEQEDGVDVIDQSKYADLINKYTATGVFIRCINVIADELQKWSNEELDGREINIVTFAYQQTKDAPVITDNNGNYVVVDESCKPHKNVIIRIAYMCNTYYSYFDEYNQDKEMYERIKKWSSICKNFMFWGYDIAFFDYFNYFPSYKGIKENVLGFKDIGVKYILMQGSHNMTNNWQCNLRSYIYNELFSNPNLDEKILLEEYINGYYGETGGRYVREYLNLMNEHYAKVVKEHKEFYLVSKNQFGNQVCLSKEVLKKGLDLFDEAENVIKMNENADDVCKYLKRIKEVKVTPFWMFLNNYDAFFSKEKKSKKAYAKEFFAMLKEINIEMYNEVSYVFERNEKYEIPALYENFGLNKEEVEKL